MANQISVLTCIMIIFSTIYGCGYGAEVPLDILRELSAMSIDQVFQKYGTNSAISPEEPQSLSVSVWTGSGTNPRYTKYQGSNVRMEAPLVAPNAEEVPFAENAGCMPRDVVIEMPNKDVAQVIYPAGTKVKRCSGVCGHSNLLCHSTGSRTISRKGLVLVYRNGKLAPTGYQTFNLTEDTSCRCRCQETPSDCRANQNYEAGNCKCACKNYVDAAECGQHRVWDSADCRCKCPNSCRTCISGSRFDEYICSCVPNSHRTQHATRKRQ